jgi:hypothetical protein
VRFTTDLKIVGLALTAAVVIGVTAGLVARSTPPSSKNPTKTVSTYKGAEPVYIRNLAPRFISDQTIRNDIPAWESAINNDFAKYWHTTKYKLVFLGRKQAPTDGITTEFINKGPVKGALAYHWTERNNAPSITVYAGTGAYYGFSNSVSFTHELEELAADPVTSYLNVGYPSALYWIQKSNGKLTYNFDDAIGWFSEVSDPVEADSYTRPGADGTPVKISDFVTPAWFNDGVGSRFDFMGLTQQPFWIRPGGYAQYLSSEEGWQVIYNFRKHHPADAGFVHDHGHIGERHHRR